MFLFAGIVGEFSCFTPMISICDESSEHSKRDCLDAAKKYERTAFVWSYYWDEEDY